MAKLVESIAIASLVLGSVFGNLNALAQPRFNSYQSIPLPLSGEINDILTEKDIPTGQKGFARDYAITLQESDRLEIALSSPAFDPIVSLLDQKGEVIGENDDATAEGSNALLFIKIKKSGVYTIRVQSFGGSSGGKFSLKATKLRPVN